MFYGSRQVRKAGCCNFAAVDFQWCSSLNLNHTCRKGEKALGLWVPGFLLQVIFRPVLGRSSLRDELGASLVPSTSQHQPELPCRRYNIISNPSAAYLMEGEGWAWPFPAPSPPASAGSHQLVVIWGSELAVPTSSEKIQFGLKVTLLLVTFRGERCLSDWFW